MSNTKTPTNFVDLSGRVFGKLVVLNRAEDDVSSSGAKLVAWDCICDCGNRHKVRSTHLVQGRSTSCGCAYLDMLKYINVKHGHCRGFSRTRTYSSWRDAQVRCYLPSNKRYPRYGGRGIGMCERWRADFSAFLADMGECPKGMTLDRIDGDRDYEPSNCRWADRTTQSRNRTYCVLSVEKAIEIRRMHSEGVSYSQIASAVGASKSSVALCVRGGSWV